MISATTWNALMDDLLRNLPLTVRHGETNDTKRHPWQVTGQWNADAEQWEAQVRPGFVNGDEVETPDSKLTDEPWLPLTSTRLVPSMPALGVGLESTPPDEERILRACDVVLYKDRLSTRATWDTGIAGVTETVLQFNVDYVSPILGIDRLAYLRVMPEYVPPLPKEIGDKLGGEWQDEPRDALKLSTIYLRSQPGAAPDEAMDATWTMHAKHDVFWNLSYGVNITQRDIKSENLQFPLIFALAGGVGAPLVQNILATLNDKQDAIAEFLAARTVTGVFWST